MMLDAWLDPLHVHDERAHAWFAASGRSEVLLVLSAADLDAPLINSTDALVAAMVTYARGEERLPRRGS